jgi:predicted outer membrane repeat protein
MIHFWVHSNENYWSDGGAIKVGSGAKIYVGNSFFESNTAARMGGAISGTASILQVLDSSFRANAAKLGGAIATNLPEAQLVLGGCNFDANDAMMGPKYGPAVAANGLVEDLGENEAQPEDLMCLDCELTSGIRIREPEPQAQPVQVNVPLQQEENSNMPIKSNEPLPSAAPLDTAGMGILLPISDEGTASMVVVEEDAEDVYTEVDEVEANDDTEEVEEDENTEHIAEENLEQIEEEHNATTGTAACTQCTNIPTAYMIETGQSCATYTYAFERRCGTEYGWWGRDGNPEHCQYSCWFNGVPHATQGDLPCCERDDADDEVVVVEEEDEEVDEAITTEGDDAEIEEVSVAAAAKEADVEKEMNVDAENEEKTEEESDNI